MKHFSKKELLSIPNCMGYFRILLIPLFSWMYCTADSTGDYYAAAVVVGVSGLTDMFDGKIARRFHMITELGKFIDPLADKLTQAALLICLAIRFRWIMVPVVLIFLKELTTGILKMVVIRKTGVVEGAEWHGKLTTVLLYLTIFIHIVWYDIPKTWSVALTVVCTTMMLISFILYGVHNVKMLKDGKQAEQ